MSDAMEEGTVLRWLKHEGDAVKKGEPIAEIETDKANMEMEAFDSGTISEIVVGEGQTVPVGTVIARLTPVGVEAAGAKGGAAAPPVEEKKEPEEPPSPREPAIEQPESAQVRLGPVEEPTGPTAARAPAPREVPAGPPAEGIIKASPLAKKIARDAGIELSQVEGTGPGGRITEADVRRFIERGPTRPSAVPPGQPESAEERPQPIEKPAEAPPPSAPVPTGEAVPLSRIRRTVARRMSESKRQVPHFYVTTRVRMDEALDLRKRLNETREGSIRIGLTDMIVKACAMALMKHPDINSSYDEDKLIRREHANIAIAVALDDGLVAPVIPQCEEKSLSQIAARSKELVEAARSGTLRPDEYSGGSFTISNMGMLDVEEFQAIIVPPESAILAVGTIYATPIVVDDAIEIAQIMKLTLSADHRVTDGAGAARFLQDVKKALENPLSLLE